MPLNQNSRSIAIATPLGADVVCLKSFSVHEQMGRLFQIDADLRSDDGTINFDDIVGQNATIRLNLAGGEVRYFNGFVSRFVQGANRGGYACYRATIVPWMWFLTRTADCRIFQDKTVPEIIEEVFKGHGFGDYEIRLSATYETLPYCVQYRETDFNFVSRLMEQVGIYYYFEHDDGKHIAVLADSISAHTPLAGYEEVPFRELEERSSDVECVTDWTVEKAVQPGAYALNDFDPLKPKTSLRVSASVTRQHASSDFEIYDYPGEYVVASEGTRLSDVRLAELQSQHEVMRGQSNVRGFSTGCTFKLKDHPRGLDDKDLLITSTSLDVDGGDFATDAGGEGGQEFFGCSLSVIDSEQAFRTARLTPKPTVQGPQTAMVVGPSGEEIHTDEHGQVKLQFHWDRYGKADENSSCWVRVSQVHAGKGYGGIDLPRIGQEVIVEFLEGDPDRPIITGRVYNGEAKPPYALPDNKTITSRKSNSSKGGGGFNEIRFEDKKGEEQIFIHGEKNEDVRIKNDCFEWIGNDRHLVVGNNQVEHVKNNRDEVVDGDHKEKIAKDRHLKVVGKEAKGVDGSLSLQVGGDVIEVFKAKQSTVVTGDLYIEADNINIKGKSNITLEVGGSTIAITSDGIGLKTTGDVKIETTGGTTIDATGAFKAESKQAADIKGTNASLKADASVEVNGSASAILKGGTVMIN